MDKLCMARHLFITVLIALTIPGPTWAQDEIKATVATPDALTWKDNPALPKGVQTAVVFGNPTKSGEMFVSRTKLPPNSQIPPHTHSFVESVTIISGSLYLGEDDKPDTQKGKLLRAGTYVFNPAQHAHYVWTTNEEAIIQIQGIGPIDVRYINPADDPRTK
jgi:quercetin dioxygenase-like cupin family protein